MHVLYTVLSMFLDIRNKIIKNGKNSFKIIKIKIISITFLFFSFCILHISIIVISYQVLQILHTNLTELSLQVFTCPRPHFFC